MLGVLLWIEPLACMASAQQNANLEALASGFQVSTEVSTVFARFHKCVEFQDLCFLCNGLRNLPPQEDTEPTSLSEPLHQTKVVAKLSGCRRTLQKCLCFKAVKYYTGLNVRENLSRSWEWERCHFPG